jgi:hypothetical protein
VDAKAWHYRHLGNASRFEAPLTQLAVASMRKNAQIGSHFVTTESPENRADLVNPYESVVLLASPTGFEPVLSP